MRAALAAILAVAALAALGAAPASAAFSPPTLVTEDGSSPKVFPRRDGGGVVAWRDKVGLSAAAFTPAMQVGPSTKLTDAATKVPALAAAATGDLIGVDRLDLEGGETRLRISHLDPAGNVSTFEIAAPEVSVDGPAVAFGRRPAAILAYEQRTRVLGQGKILLARLSRAGEPDSTVTVAPGSLPHLAARTNGEAALAWSSGNGHAVTTVDRDNEVASIKRIPERRGKYIADVAWGEAPRAAALLVGATGTSGSGAGIRLVRFGGAPRSTKTLRVTSARQVSSAQLAVDGRGHTWIAWRDGSSRGLEVHVRRLSRAGKLGPELSLSRGGDVTDVRLAAGAEEAGVAWHTSDGDSQAIRFAGLTSKGQALPPETIYGTDTQSVHAPAVAFEDDRALVAFCRQGGGEGGTFLTRESG